MALESFSSTSTTSPRDANAVDATVKTELAENVTALSLSTPPLTPSLRRSPRKRTIISFKEEADDEQHGLSSKFWSAGSTSSSRKRAAVSKKEEDSDTLPVLTESHAEGAPKRKAKKHPKTPSPKKVKREYAPPETYAHLECLSDYLGEHLDVMFCGINPGYKSAETGHHFAHATNHFWRALHLSGFTDRLLKPSEDSTLPASYNLGLTNLVERPSAEQAELSLHDMRAGVPTLLSKIAAHRPRVVCFVGKQIGAVFLNTASALSASPFPPSSPGSPAHPAATGSADTPQAHATGAAKAKAKAKAKKKDAFAWGFQPYTFPHAPPSAVRATLFFVMPSSSARVTGYQLGDKVKILKALHEEVQRLKAGEAGMDTSGWTVLRDVAVEAEE